MKTTTIIIAAVLTLQAGFLFAGNESSSAPVTNESASISLATLAPSTPAEATFEEFAAANEFGSLIPAVPTEATFEDVSGDMASTFTLAPATPVTADFEDVADGTIDFSALAPVPPATADFE
jgi:hypothetical protein